MTKALIIFAALTALLSSLAVAQDFDRAEIFGGYSYLNVDTNGLTSRQGMNGWEASFAYKVNPWLAAEADFSGHYKSYGASGTFEGISVNAHANVSDYGYVFGPRLEYHALFVHALFGGDHLGANGSASASIYGDTISGSASASQDGFAMAIGGGVQHKVARNYAIRGGADWVLRRHNVLGEDPVNQNNFRLGAGVVYTFGGGAKREAPPQNQRTVSSRTTPPAAVPATENAPAAPHADSVPSKPTATAGMSAAFLEPGTTSVKAIQTTTESIPAAQITAGSGTAQYAARPTQPVTDNAMVAFWSSI